MDYQIYWGDQPEVSLKPDTRVRLILLDKTEEYALCNTVPLQTLVDINRDILLGAWNWCKTDFPKAYPLWGTPLIVDEDEGLVSLMYVFRCEETLAGEKLQNILDGKAYPLIRKMIIELAKERKNAYGALKYLLPQWYRANAREFPWRKDKNPYHIWLSEIMLQQTRAVAAIVYYERFLKELPTIKALAEAEEAKVLKLWEGLGYYSRARNLHKAAKQILIRHNGVFPGTIEEIRALPGIGEYTAGAIGAICFDLPEPAIDGNVLRVLSRITADYRPIENSSLKKSMYEEIKCAYPDTNRGVFEQSLIELGATVCPPNAAPQCEVCPLQKVCLAKRQETQLLLPVRTPKKQRRIEYKTVLLLYCGDKLAVCRRGDEGLLAGMWELPNTEGKHTPQQALDLADSYGVYPLRLMQSLERKHIFTHVEWHMRGFVIQCAEQSDAFCWVDPGQLEEAIALPSAFRIFLQE